ncbi:MAG: transcriptional regulator [Betaproteobacteria bacterium]|nr:transcriptional regulator [Betaproteobacteria bacterium]
MSTSSTALSERARKNERLVLQRLADVGQAAVAAQLDASESTISRLKDGPIANVCNLLAAVGLKVVPVEFRCTHPERVQAIMTLYKAMLDASKNPVELLLSDADESR